MLELTPPEAEDRPGLSEFKLYTNAEFFDALHADIDAAGPEDRIAMLTMSLEPSDPQAEMTLNKLGSAAERGAEVVFGVDAYTFTLDTANCYPGPLWLPMPLVLPHYKRRYDALDKLDTYPSAQTGVINAPDKPFSNPFAGRSHLKLNIVNNKVYIGGPSLDGTDRSDLTIGWEDPKSADILFAVCQEIVKKRTTRSLGSADVSIPLNGNTEVMIDVGIPGQSHIQDRALRIISDANDWLVYSGQFFPKGSTLEAAKLAHARDVDTYIAFNHPSNHGGVKTLWQTAVMLSERRATPEALLRAQTALGSTTIHAAGIAAEHAAIKGGHNFNDVGVKWGTTEIALHTTDPSLAQSIGINLLASAGIAAPGNIRGY